MTRLPSLSLPTLPGMPPPRRRRQRSQQPELTSEEERSLLNKVMSGVEYVGLSLDKPGAAVRGTLSGLTGGPWGGGLANLVPFSDTMGLTNKRERVWGQELLHRWGLTPKNKPGLNITDPADLAGDVAGLGFEILTDPLLWATGPLGAIAKGAKGASLRKAIGPGAAKALQGDDVAAAATHLAERMVPGASTTAPTTTLSQYAQQLQSGERGLLGMGPLWIGGKTVGKGLEKVAKSKATAAVRGLFSKSAGARSMQASEFKVGTQLLREGAWAENQKLVGAVMDIMPTYTARRDWLFKKYEDIAQHFGKQGDQATFNDMLRMLGETKDALPNPDQIADALQTSLRLGPSQSVRTAMGQVDDFAAKYHGFLDETRNAVNGVYDMYRGLGGRGELLTDEFVEHMARQLSPGLRRQMMSGSGEDFFQFMRHRNELLREFPGGSTQINLLSRNRLLTATARTAKSKADVKGLKTVLRNQLEESGIDFTKKESVRALQKRLVLHSVKKELQAEVQAGTITKARRGEILAEWTQQPWTRTYTNKRGKQVTVTKANSRLDYTVNYFRALPEATLDSGLFGQDVMTEMFMYMNSAMNKIADLRMAHSFLAQKSAVIDAGLGESLASIWKGAGFSRGTTEMVDGVLKQSGLHKFVAENAGHADAAGLRGLTNADDAAKATDKYINGLTMSEESAGILKAFGAIQEPGNISVIGKGFDKMRALYAGPLTIPWPAFHTRNLGSGYWQSLTDGKVNPFELTRGYTAAARHAKTGKGLEFVDEFVDAGGLSGHGRIQDIVGERLAAGTGEVPEGFLAGFRTGAKEGTWNPLHMRGLQEPTEAMVRKGLKPRQSKPMEMGEHAYKWVEFLNRAGYYEALRKKGFSPSQAFYWVKRSQFDYSQLSRFEKDVMRRGTLFYAWGRKNIPYQFQKLMERPGGPAAQTYRALTQSQRDEESYVPSFLREMMGFRAGGTEQAAHFVRQTGIPIEDLNRMVFRGGRPTARTFGKLAGQLHPLLLAPIEQAAGRQFWSGRKFKEMRSPTERIQEQITGKGEPHPAIDRAMNISPVSRALWEVLGVADERKSWSLRMANMMTGFKFATYDTQRFLIQDLKKELEQQAKGFPVVREGQYLYVPERYEEAAQAEEAKEKLRLIAALQKRQKEYRLSLEKQEAGRAK